MLNRRQLIQAVVALAISTPAIASRPSRNMLFGGVRLMRIYSGTPPAKTNIAPSGNTVLAEWDMEFPDSASGGILHARMVKAESIAIATGTATFFRLLRSDETAVMQGTVGIFGADMNFNTTTICAGSHICIPSFAIKFDQAISQLRI